MTSQSTRPCGKKVVTPLSPTDWKLTFDDKTVSLYPSVGSWSLPCRSHYWITQNKVRWAEQWTDDQIQAGRAYDAAAKQTYFGETTMTPNAEPIISRPVIAAGKPGLLARLKDWWSS